MRKTLNSLLFISIFFLVFPSHSFSGDSALSQDIHSLSNLTLDRLELETTKEFKERIDEIYERFSNRTYKLSISPKNPPFSDHKFLQYDPDTSILTISLPRLSQKLLWVEKRGKQEIAWLTFSHIQTESDLLAAEVYVARSAFGQEIEIEKIHRRDSGVAILGKVNPDLTPQQFTLNVTREKVRELLDEGKLILHLRSDLQRLGENPFLLLSETKESKPTIRAPYHTIIETKILPARLISVELYDREGNLVYQAEGKQITTNALR